MHRLYVYKRTYKVYISSQFCIQLIPLVSLKLAMVGAFILEEISKHYKSGEGFVVVQKTHLPALHLSSKYFMPLRIRTLSYLTTVKRPT